MKTCLRILVTASVVMFLVFACSLVFAGDGGNARVRAALALSSAATKAKTEAKSGCGCSCAGRGCSCAFPGECGDPGCCCAAKAPVIAKGQSLSTTALERGIEEAIRRKTHLVLWVGEACLPCEKKLRGYTHCRLTEYSGVNGTETGPEVIVCRREGSEFIIVARIEGIPADLAGRVRDALNPPVPQAMRQPVMMMPPPMPMMMPMMGGFGGGGC